MIPSVTCRLAFGLLVGGLSLPAATASAQTPQATGLDSAGQGLLRPGDVVKLNVWREPEWSGEFPVNEDGVVVFPRIGPLQVTSMSSETLRRFLTDSLGRFLRNPSIEVTPLRRIQVLGAVRNPGLYPVPPTVAVGDVVALAGGATPDGKPNQVILRRGSQDLQVDLTSGTRLADTPIRTGDQLFVPQRSWISRNAGLVAAGLSAATTLFVALMVR